MSAEGPSRRSFLYLGAAGLGAVVAGGVLAGTPAADARTPAGSVKPLRCDPVFTDLAQQVGVNCQSVNGPAMTDTNFVGIANQSDVNLFRFPGGTTANYWDWQKGWVLDDSDLPASGAQFAGQNPIPWYLEDLKSFCDSTGTTPVFVLNIGCSTLQYQLDMLDYADGLGLPITYVELGNELYFGTVTDLFATVADYASTASDWADAIKTAYPDAQIATVAYDNNDTQPNGRGGRTTTWNAGMASTLASNSNITAVTMHPYVFLNYIETNFSEITDLSLTNRQRLLATAFDAKADVTAALDNDIPSGKDLWVTEYNFIDKNHVAHSRWIQASHVAAMSLTLLTEPRCSVSLVHSLTGALNFAMNHQPAYATAFHNLFGITPVAWDLTAVGIGINDVFLAINGATGFATVPFAESSTITVSLMGSSRSYESILAVQFDHGTSTNAIVLNLSDEALNVDLASYNLGTGGLYKQHSAPYDTVVADSSSDVMTTTGPVSSSVTLEPYSVTTVY